MALNYAQRKQLEYQVKNGIESDHYKRILGEEGYKEEVEKASVKIGLKDSYDARLVDKDNDNDIDYKITSEGKKIHYMRYEGDTDSSKKKLDK